MFSLGFIKEIWKVKVLKGNNVSVVDGGRKDIVVRGDG